MMNVLERAGRRFVLTLLTLSLVGTVEPASRHHERISPRLFSVEPIPPDEVAAWQNDLDQLVKELERVHPNSYGKTSEAEFDRAVAALRQDIPRLAAHEIIVGFARLLARVGDGHTTLPLFGAPGVAFHILPYRLGIYDDGVYVEAADREYAALVGGKLIAIGGTPASEVMSRVAGIISRDNENWIGAVAPHLLNRIEVLHALGLSESLNHAELKVAREGATLTVQVSPLSEPQSATHALPYRPQYTESWVDARHAAEPQIPFYQRRFDDIYWWEYVDAKNLLYIKWDQVQNRESGPPALTMFREAMEFARERRPAKTVIDIRNKTGGEGGLVPPIVREIVRTREIDEPGRLFLVIGRRTFSAGQMMTAMLEQFSTAILVGEPSSAFYNGYAGHLPSTLPNSRITFMVSPDYYQMGPFPRDRRQQATPRLAAVPSFADYIENRDPALEAIEQYDPHAAERLADDVKEAVDAGDETRAMRLIRDYDEQPVHRFFDSSSALNARGYRFLRGDRVEDAIALFRLNVHMHSGYANGWDSLGEAYVRAGRREDAIEAFRKALELDPGLASSRQWLERLTGSR